MSSVENLGRRLWAQKAKGKGGESSSAFQVRLDLTSDQQLNQLSADLGIAKATLAQEILRAGIGDVLRSNPYATSGDVLDQQELEEGGWTGDEILMRDGRPVLAGEE